MAQKYRQIMAAIYGQPWAILPEKLLEIVDLVEMRRAGGKYTPPEITALIGEGSGGDKPQQVGSVRIIPIQGVIAQKLTLMQKISGGTSTEQVSRWLRQAVADPDVSAIVLDTDSPGGSVFGLEELAQQIFEARKSKRIVAVANPFMASAAYYLASQASEVIASPSASVGSIGTVMVHTEVSEAEKKMGVKRTVVAAGKHKADGNPYQPLSEQSQGTLNQTIEAYYAQFVNAVARGRGTTAEAVRAGYGQGRVLIASQAVTERLVDRVASLQQVLEELNQTRPVGGAVAKGSAPQLLPVESSMPDTPVHTTPPAATTPPVASPPPAASPPVADAQLTPQQISQQATAAERLRVSTITAAAKQLGFGCEAIAEKAVAEGLSVDQFNAQAVAHLAAVNTPANVPAHIRTPSSELENFALAASQGLAMRCFGRASVTEALAPGAEEFRNRRLIDIAEECLLRSNPQQASRFRGMSREMVAKMALSQPTDFDQSALVMAGAYYTSGSFANLALNAFNKGLAKGFEEAPTTYQLWCSRGPNMSDFRLGHIVKFGEGSDLEEVPEGDEPTEDTGFSDDREVIRLARYAKTMDITFQMILADELSALSQAPAKMGYAARRTLNRLVYAVLTSNPTMLDGYQLFDATNHQGNDLTTGLPPSVSELSLMRTALRLMTGLNSDSRLNLVLKYLIVPSALETTAQQLVLSLADPAASGNSAVHNPFRNVIPVAEPELDASSSAVYYGAADPMQHETIQFRFLEGQEMPVQTSWYEPKRAVRTLQVEQSFGVAAAEYRTLVRNAGSGGS